MLAETPLRACAVRNRPIFFSGGHSAGYSRTAAIYDRSHSKYDFSVAWEKCRSRTASRNFCRASENFIDAFSPMPCNKRTAPQSGENQTRETKTHYRNIMARSIRVLYRAQEGHKLRKNVNWDAINLDSAVVVTAAEFTPNFGGFGGGLKTLGRPNLGAAKVELSNIGPHGRPGGEAGGVEFYLGVYESDPVDVVVTITVLEDIEQFIQSN